MSNRLQALAFSISAVGALLIGSAHAVATSSTSGLSDQADRFGVVADDPAFGDLLAFMLGIGASQPDAETLAGIAMVPGNVEFIKPFGQAGQASQPDLINPVLVATADLHINNMAELAAPGGPLAAGQGPLGTVTYGQGLTQPSGTDWYVYAKRFKAPCGPSDGEIEWGVVAEDTTPLNGGNPAPLTSGSTANLFYGINTAYVLHGDPGQPLQAVRYERNEAGSATDFATTDSDWIGICTGSTVIGLIPWSEWDGITELRFFGFEVPVGSTGELDPANGSQMRYPGIDDDAMAIDDTIEEIDVGEEPPVPTDTPAPTATAAPTPTRVPPTATPTDSRPIPTPPPPTPAPTTPTITTTPGGFDPLILLALAGLGLIGLAVALWLISRPKDCDELGKLAKAAQEACDRARQAAAEANANHDKAAADLQAIQAYERAATRNLADAEGRLAKAQARAAAPGSESYVEGDPYGRLTGDDLALQNDANAAAKAEADAAKADARQAWKDAGSPQGAGAKQLDDDLNAIGRALSDKMTHNNDPQNIDELRRNAASAAKAEMGKHEADVAAARQSLEDATASLRDASETESGARAAAESAQAEADRICNEAAAAQKAYNDCIGAESAAATAVKPTTVKPTTVGVDTGTTGGGGKVGGGTTKGGGTTSKDNPPARPCHDGDESWEPMGPARTFEIRADGAKTRVTIWTDPPIKGLDEWIKGSASAGGRESGEDHPSITSPEVDFIPGQLNGWLAGLGGGQGKAAPLIDLHAEIKTRRLTIQCERRWVCENGAWVAAQGETRANITDSPSTHKIDRMGVEPSIQKVSGFIGELTRKINELKKNEEEAEKAKRCE